MRVGVVGGGITGLALAHYLQGTPVEPVLFESREQVGGVIQSERVDGRLLEFGPQRSRLTAEIESLVDDLDLREELLLADEDLPIYVYCDGRLREVPTSIPAFVRTDLLSWRGKLRLLAEPLTRPATPEETPAEAFSRKFGRETYENLIGPLFGGIYGSDPARMSTEHALSGLVALERREGSLLKPALKRALSDESAPAFSFREGLQTLPEALADANRDVVHTGSPVRSIRQSGDRCTLATDDGEVSVDQVVVTTPADVAADLLETVDDSASRLRDLRYNPLALVHLHAESDRMGMGYQIRHDEEFATLGVSWNAPTFGREGVYTAFLGGMANPGLVAESDDHLRTVAREEFEAIVDEPAEVLSVRRLRQGFPAYDESWSALDEVTLPDGVYLATNYAARMGIPGRVRQAKGLSETLAEMV
jgi:oxygen-dependent protoporphyrinogen oxidase